MFVVFVVLVRTWFQLNDNRVTEVNEALGSSRTDDSLIVIVIVTVTVTTVLMTLIMIASPPVTDKWFISLHYSISHTLAQLVFV